MHIVATLVVILVGAYLIGLGIGAWVRPTWVRSWFEAFASSARAHYLEQLIRLLVALSLIYGAKGMLFPGVFSASGWIILITTLGLLVIPWKWHRRFAGMVVPMILRYMYLYTGMALLMGVFLLYCVVQPYFVGFNTP